MVAAVSSNLSAAVAVAVPASAAPPLNTESSAVNTNTGNNISTVARKRRRQILQTLRETKASASCASTTTIGEPNPKKMCTSESQDTDIDTDTSQTQDQTQGSGTSSSSVSDPPAITQDPPAYIVTSSKTNTLRARKVSHCDGIAPPANADAIQAALSSDDPKTKRPQMRYEPDVPMTKEEATAWRREQRRKRNRESAAASRQRQRDRIAELEVEVDEWKVKYQAALDRLKGMESLHDLNSGSMTSRATVTGGLTVSLPLSQDDSIRISPCPSPKPIHHSVTAVPSEVLSSTIAIPRCAGTSSNANVKIATSAMTLNARTEEKEEHLKENHSLPAVKITGADSSLPPVLSGNCALSDHDCGVSTSTASTGSDSAVPDLCSSSKVIQADVVASSTTSMVSKKASANANANSKRNECLDDIQRLTDEELEFDEFLMDAAEWL